MPVLIGDVLTCGFTEKRARGRAKWRWFIADPQGTFVDGCDCEQGYFEAVCSHWSQYHKRPVDDFRSAFVWARRIQRLTPSIAMYEHCGFTKEDWKAACEEWFDFAAAGINPQQHLEWWLERELDIFEAYGRRLERPGGHLRLVWSQ